MQFMVELDDATVVKALAACRGMQGRHLDRRFVVGCVLSELANATGEESGILRDQLEQWLADHGGGFHTENVETESVGGANHLKTYESVEVPWLPLDRWVSLTKAHLTA